LGNAHVTASANAVVVNLLKRNGHGLKRKNREVLLGKPLKKGGAKTQKKEE